MMANVPLRLERWLRCWIEQRRAFYIDALEGPFGYVPVHLVGSIVDGVLWNIYRTA